MVCGGLGFRVEAQIQMMGCVPLVCSRRRCHDPHACLRARVALFPWILCDCFHGILPTCVTLFPWNSPHVCCAVSMDSCHVKHPWRHAVCSLSLGLRSISTSLAWVSPQLSTSSPGQHTAQDTSQETSPATLDTPTDGLRLLRHTGYVSCDTRATSPAM